MKKTRILALIMSALLTVSSLTAMAMPAVAAEPAEFGTELLTDGAWSGHKNVSVSYASAKGVRLNWQYFLGGLTSENKLEAGKYLFQFKGRSTSTFEPQYLHVESMKGGNTNLEYNIGFDANKKLVPGDYTISITLRGKTGQEKFTFQTRNGGKDLPMDDASTTAVEANTVMNLTTDWQTFKTTLHFDEMWNNVAYNVWILLINKNSDTATFDIADFSFKDANGNEYVTKPFKTRNQADSDYPNDAFVKGSGWTFTNKCDTTNTKIYNATARTETMRLAIRNVEMSLACEETGASSKDIKLTKDWQTFSTVFDIYSDVNTPSGVNTNLCETFTKNGTLYNAWLNFNNRSTETTDAGTVNVGVSYDIADYVLIQLSNGQDRLAGPVLKPEGNSATGWETPSAKNASNQNYAAGVRSIKTEAQPGFSDSLTYTYNGDGKAIDAGMYALEAKLVTDEQKGTAIEALVTYLNAVGEEKTEIINTNDGAKSALVTRAWDTVSFVFSADEAITVKSVGFRKADAANTANVRFEDVSFKGVSEFGEDKTEAELVARLDTDFGAAVVTPEGDSDDNYLTVYDRASATDGIKIVTSELGYDATAKCTVKFNIRTSVAHEDQSRIHTTAGVKPNSQVRIRTNGAGGVTENFGSEWKAVSKDNVELGRFLAIVGGGSAEYTAPFDIDDIEIVVDGNVVWSENFDSCRVGALENEVELVSDGLNGNTGNASLTANKNAGVKLAVDNQTLIYSKKITDGELQYTGEEIVLEPGIYTIKGSFRNASYIATAAEIQWNVGAANGPYTVFKNGKIEDYNKFSLKVAVKTEDDNYISSTGTKDITAGWTEYSYKFKVEEKTKLTDITFYVEHAVDGKTVNIDYKDIALYWSPIPDRGDRPNPGIVMMLLLKMKEGSYVKTVKNDYLEIRNLSTKGFEYTLWRDAKNPIEIGTYTLTIKLRGATGGEQLKLRVRNAYIPMMNVASGAISETVTLTDEYTVFTATVPVTEESFNGNGKDYHVWITFDKVGGSVSFDIDDLSFVKDGKEYIVDGLKQKNAAHSDSYVKASGWFTTDPGCSFGTVTERVERDTGKRIGG